MSSLRTNWPALAFSVAIVLAVFLLTTPSFCSDGETPATCSREWLNASGNILVVAVALLAARVAYNQYAAAERQANLASLPSLEARLVSANKVYRTGNEAFILVESYLSVASELDGLFRSET